MDLTVVGDVGYLRVPTNTFVNRRQLAKFLTRTLYCCMLSETSSNRENIKSAIGKVME